MSVVLAYPLRLTPFISIFFINFISLKCLSYNIATFLDIVGCGIKDSIGIFSPYYPPTEIKKDIHFFKPESSTILKERQFLTVHSVMIQVLFFFVSWYNFASG